MAEIMVGRKVSEKWMEIKQWLAGAWSTKGRKSEWGHGWHGGWRTTRYCNGRGMKASSVEDHMACGNLEKWVIGIQ